MSKSSDAFLLTGAAFLGAFASKFLDLILVGKNAFIIIVSVIAIFLIALFWIHAAGFLSKRKKNGS
jgi:hypothetical protein